MSEREATRKGRSVEAASDRPSAHIEAELSRWVTLAVPLTAICGLYAVVAWDSRNYARNFDGELGVLENVQIVVLMVALMYGVAMLRMPALREHRGLMSWIALICVGCVLMIGEETSYGQHFMGWRTPQWLAEANKQQEINIHNMSSWFNEKPRVLLELGVIAGGIVHPLMLRFRGRGLIAKPWWLMPTGVCLATALIAEISTLPERLFDIGLLPSSVLVMRSSEIHELFLFYFFVIYLASLRARLGALALVEKG